MPKNVSAYENQYPVSPITVPNQENDNETQIFMKGGEYELKGITAYMQFDPTQEQVNLGVALNDDGDADHNEEFAFDTISFGCVTNSQVEGTITPEESLSDLGDAGMLNTTMLNGAAISNDGSNNSDSREFLYFYQGQGANGLEVNENEYIGLGAVEGIQDLDQIKECSVSIISMNDARFPTMLGTNGKPTEQGDPNFSQQSFEFTSENFGGFQ